jgi:hypothetical protein
VKHDFVVRELAKPCLRSSGRAVTIFARQLSDGRRRASGDGVSVFDSQFPMLDTKGTM